jgi:hypothetical protein
MRRVTERVQLFVGVHARHPRRVTEDPVER